MLPTDRQMNILYKQPMDFDAQLAATVPIRAHLFLAGDYGP